MQRNKDLTKNVPNKVITRRANGSVRVQVINDEPTRTQQNHKEECDVNNIVAKFRRTGSITHIRNTLTGVYADLTALPVDLQQARQVVIQAENAFNDMPAELRQRFGHDPLNMIKFLEDPSNNEEAIKLGLKTRPAPEPENPIVNTLKNIEKNTKPKKKPDPE